MSKERLVELIGNAPIGVNGITLLDKHELKVIEEVADYLIANGVVVPTYNIGQTVYAVTKGDDLWWKGIVASICYEFNEMSYGIMFDDGDFAMFEEECIFPTKKEAVAKLKESENNA